MNNEQHPEWEAPPLPDPARTGEHAPPAAEPASTVAATQDEAPVADLPLDTWTSRSGSPSSTIKWIGAAAGLAVVGGIVGAISASRHTVTQVGVTPAAATSTFQQPPAGAFGQNGPPPGAFAGRRGGPGQPAASGTSSQASTSSRGS